MSQPKKASPVEKRGAGFIVFWSGWRASDDARPVGRVGGIPMHQSGNDRHLYNGPHSHGATVFATRSAAYGAMRRSRDARRRAMGDRVAREQWWIVKLLARPTRTRKPAVKKGGPA